MFKGLLFFLSERTTWVLALILVPALVLFLALAEHS